jgi:hypothetical protein
MSELDGFRARLETARQAYAAMPHRGRGEPGPPDAQTGERWDRGNVLGHVAELVPFWTAQARSVLAGATEFGRGEAGYQQRRAGIESADRLTEAQLQEQIQDGIADLDAFLSELTDADLEREARYLARTGDRDMTLRIIVEDLLVGHVEAHARQLSELA